MLQLHRIQTINAQDWTKGSKYLCMPLPQVCHRGFRFHVLYFADVLQVERKVHELALNQSQLRLEDSSTKLSRKESIFFW